MQIFVRSVDRVFAVNVEQDASLNELKAAIEDVEFIPTGKILSAISYTRIMAPSIIVTVS